MPKGCHVHRWALEGEAQHHQGEEVEEEHRRQEEGVEEEEHHHQVVEGVGVVLQVLSIPVLGAVVALMGLGLEGAAEAGDHRVQSQAGEVVEEDWEKLLAVLGEAQLGLEEVVEGQREGRRVRQAQAGPLGVGVEEEVERLDL